MQSKAGLVLSGGGARAAYQVGALRALAELAREHTPFQIVTGVSGGAINSIAVAAAADDFATAVARLEWVWRSLTPERVYRTDLGSLAAIGFGWLRQLIGGGWLGPVTTNSLLDTSPLRALLADQLSMARVARHVATGRLRGAAVTATSYDTGNAVTFFDAAPDVTPWRRTGREARRTHIRVDHVMASSAIPLLFPPVSIGGHAFGDGCVRLTAPLSPAIRLGADRLIAIGIRYSMSAAEAAAVERHGLTRPTPAEIGGVLLNAVFLDSLEADFERLERINGTLSLLDASQRANLIQPLRPIPAVLLQPSVDLGLLAVEQYRAMPRTLRHLLRGIGADGQRGWDLLSYLAFEPVYIGHLIDLGYADTRARRDELAAFFAAEAMAA